MKPKIKRKRTDHWKNLTNMIVSKEMDFGFKFWASSLNQRKTPFMKRHPQNKRKLKKNRTCVV